MSNTKPNQTSFKKGVSGNPKGKPVGTISLKTKLIEALNKIHQGTGKRYDVLLVESMLRDGVKTDGQSRKLIIQYLEGMPQQNLDLTTKGDKIYVDESTKEKSNKAVGNILKEMD